MESLITVASFPMDYQAHSARNFLQEHGVECFLADEHLQDVNWVHSPISGAGVRLQVRESNEEAARNLLTLFERHRPDIVIHLAAQAGVRYSLENPRAYLDSNLVGTFNIMECKSLGMRLKNSFQNKNNNNVINLSFVKQRLT